MIKFFKFDILITSILLLISFGVGGWHFVALASILAILEISLSFDNAVINATVLKDMSKLWQKRFLTWGIVIAVFGMRVLFPLLIVMIAGHVNILTAVKTALFHPNEYETIMKSAHIGIAGFGGAFLCMVALKYWFDLEKEVHWLKIIEQPLQKLGKLDCIEIVITLLVIYAVSKLLPIQTSATFIISGIFGLVVYLLVDSLGGLLNADNLNIPLTVAKGGLASFLYLEVLDASFSFDGVIGAFAITDDFILMAIGLGIGACFVRSLTLLMVEKGTLDAYEYLEPAAFWAITVLTVVMLLSPVVDIPSLFTGLSSAIIISLGVLHSVIQKSKTK